MTRFFWLLILILFISWLVVGLQQEKEKLKNAALSVENEQKAKLELYDEWFDSLKRMPAYQNYTKITKGGILFLLPDDFTEQKDLTNEHDAIFQFSLSNKIYGIVYSDPIVSDPQAYNFSKENYCESTLLLYRKSKQMTLYDSTVVDIFPAFRAIKAHFLVTRVDDTGVKDSLAFSLISMQNNTKLYMLFLYGRASDFAKSESIVENIFKSVALLNE